MVRIGLHEITLCQQGGAFIEAARILGGHPSSQAKTRLAHYGRCDANKSNSQMSRPVAPCELPVRVLEFFRISGATVTVPPRKVNRKKPNKQKRKQRASSPGKQPSKSARRHLDPIKHAVGTTTVRSPVGTLFEEFIAIQARLRAPGGCPWDREQTHATLKTYLIEEAYEVLDALENGNANELSEELGDLLLQVLFHADIALEAGAFDISDVIIGIRDKMLRRHPHVFGNVKAETAGDVLKNWAQLKAQEKRGIQKEASLETPPIISALDGVPRSLPALLEAYQLTRRAAQVGFDWENVGGIFEKLHEETVELQVALEKSARQDIEEELGDLLFVCVNLSRFLGTDPEVALKYSNMKFKSRFQLMETEASQMGQRLSQLSKVELETRWESTKMKVRVPTASGSEL
jgi:MazG family protein